ncbi:MAG: hypothetical protein ACJ79A_11095 [Gemmatimonadaceae bacterium]
MALNFFRRWQAKHLLLAWVVYWVLLAVVSLRSALVAAARALNAPKGLGSLAASVDNGNVILKATAAGQTWTGSTSLTTMMLWFAGPPLVLFLVWLVTRRAPVTARDPERDYRIS